MRLYGSRESACVYGLRETSRSPIGIVWVQSRMCRAHMCLWVDAALVGLYRPIYIYVYIKTGVSERDRDSCASCALCVMTSCVPNLRYWSLMDINGFSTHGSGISGSMRLMRYDDMSAVPVLDRRRVIL